MANMNKNIKIINENRQSPLWKQIRHNHPTMPDQVIDERVAIFTNTYDAYRDVFYGNSNPIQRKGKK